MGAHIQVEVNGKITIRWHDPESRWGGPHRLRSMAGVDVVAYDSFLVWQVTPKSKRQPAE